MTSAIISEENLANTYESGTGWKTVRQYRTAIDLRERNPDLPRAEIARRIDRLPGTVRGWLVDGSTPGPVRGLDTATEHGWLSADMESELFRALNALTAWIYAGGEISQETFVPTFSADELVDVVTLDHLLAVVDLPYRTRENGDDQAIGVLPGVGAPVCGRLLSTLGAPVGRKAINHSLTLPPYLSEAPQHLRRDFARVYLLVGATPLSEKGRYQIEETRTSEYIHESQAFLSSVLNAEVALGGQNRLIIPSEGTATLCEGDPRRPALAAKIAHGTTVPPTERAVLSTYRRGKSPSGPRYVDAYRAATERTKDETAIVEEYDLSRVTIYNWQQGTTPKLVTAGAAVRERGWLLPDTPEPARTLTALSAWLVASGSLQQTFNPVFRLRTEAQRRWFQTLTGRLELPMSTRFEDDPDRTTEAHVSTDASRLGRVLYAMGVPKSGQDSGELTPPFVWTDVGLARAYVTTWVLHHGTLIDNELRIGAAYGGSEWSLRALAALCSERLEWNVRERTDDRITVSYVDARPDILQTLPSGVTTEFEQSQTTTE